MYATITAKLGVHTGTTAHATQRAAEMAARRAIRSGESDSAAVWMGQEQVRIFGAGR